MQKKKFSFRWLALALTFALLLPLAPAAVPTASAVTQAEINALKSDANKLDQQKKDIQSQLKAVQADKDKAQDQKELLEQQIGIINQAIRNLQNQISMYEELIAEKEAELAEAQAREEEQYELFCQRIRFMEEAGETSYWSILFSSKDFSDLLDNFIMVEEIIQYDNGIMDSLMALQAAIEERKTSLKETKAELDAAKAEQEAAKSELKAQEAEVDRLIAEISAKEGELQAAEAALRKAANAMDAEIKRLEREMAAQISQVVSESGFMWPLKSSINTLSSLYGSRKDPINGSASNHTGIDIPAASGTPIYAAKSGVVTTSKQAGSYGNHVVVSHSDGTSTLYAHMSRRNATVGQTVKQGDVIGYVGTTGRSTGNHLHFEIRINGNRTDPLNYFKDKTLYYKSGGKTVVLPH
ncbi:MAG: peptidoglycan DD-metalloendopeptidase family protein [Lawsonibacter sp.]|nr:peptidoglycan DD-metalloendopeptidase family protein [Lawsonibacter sp.]